MQGAEKVDMGANIQLKKNAGIILSAEPIYKYHMFYYYETHEKPPQLIKGVGGPREADGT